MTSSTTLSLVRSLMGRGDYAQARERAGLAVEQEPSFYLYHEVLGDIHRHLGDSCRARTNYTNALSLRPTASWLNRKRENLPSLPRPKVCGIYERYPDLTGKRQLEGGTRLEGRKRVSQPGLPLVTIVTVVYDNPDTLQRCIDSVTAQTYPNVEYIIVDGGSSKETLDIIKRNKEHIDYFVSEPDKGIYAAMNKGLRLARGEYICLLNSDDFYASDFVSETIAAGRNTENTAGTKVDIVYTDYVATSTPLCAGTIDDGLFFGHLNICHNTFLARATAYDRVGFFNEDFYIVSDAVWIREARICGLHFQHLKRHLFTLSDGGLSSGSTEAKRKLFIREAGRSYRLNFPQLSQQDAEAIYLFRFNKARTHELLAIARRYRQHDGIVRALRGYVTHCLRNRDNFRFTINEDNKLTESLCDLVALLGVSLHNVQLQTSQGPLADVLKRVDDVIARKRINAGRTVLHFATVFSAPSETFIYNLLLTLETEQKYNNFILFEHSLLSAQRPYANQLLIPWSDLPSCIGEQIYEHIITRLKPDVIIAHFALNEWKWAQRAKKLGKSIPTLTMCHGIDVFSLRTNATYRDYILNDFSRRSNTSFTAVSEYLKGEMLANGIPEKKIHLLPNSVNDRFFQHRKTADYYKRDRTLRLLSIGRLLRLKGHRYLIAALELFRDECTPRFHLTIVYGNGADELRNLEKQVAEANLQEHVTFEPFVDLNKDPGFISRFDCFIHPSTYSDDAMHRSETFGVSVLEAIAAGLPVITTDAGGLPEVVGQEGTFARLVPHGNAKALADALSSMWRDGRAFADNRMYAAQRLEAFSSQSQIRKLTAIIDKLATPTLKAAMFSSTTQDGAGYAAYRLFKGLQSTSIEPEMFTRGDRHVTEPHVTFIPHGSGNIRQWYASQFQPKPGITINTINHRHLSSARLVSMVQPYDIINLHWHARFLSLENVATLTRLGKPVVMTVRDMMPITGGCHYFHGCNKWLKDCADCPQMPDHLKDYPRRALALKRRHFDFSNLTLVALSSHSRAILERAPYFNQCRIETILNSIDTSVFVPHLKELCRNKFGLPQDRKIIGYVPSFSSDVKGSRQFLDALQHEILRTSGLDCFVMLIGHGTPEAGKLRQDSKTLGYITDHATLAQAYSAADVIVVPSLEETFSNTTAEAISCGVPVVGFRTGAIPDLVIDGRSGYAAELGNVDDLAYGIAKVLRGPDLSAMCRAHAEKLVSFMIQAKKYEELFLDLVAKRSFADGVKRRPAIMECFASLELLKKTTTAPLSRNH